MSIRIDKVTVLGTGVLGSQIAYSSNLADAVRDADLVIEAVPEIPEVKKQLYAKLGSVAPEKTIFASNSSTLLPSAMAGASGRPDRFLALHFANEIWTRNVAEIMGHAGTSPAVYDATVEFARRIGMEPIEIHKEQPGYVLNSLLIPFLQAAASLVVNGVADPETIDKTWRIATGAPEGPLQTLDIVGLNTVYNIAAASDEQGKASARYIKEHYIDKGKLGQASGEGFYKYEKPTARSSSIPAAASA